MNYTRYYIITVKFKDEDFADLAITNYKITPSLIDKTTSLAAGIPLKKEQGYLKEFLALILRENVPGVDKHCYKSRNPIIGEEICKGAKDIQRAQLICSIKSKNKYAKYCKILNDLTVKKLADMPLDKRDKYFNELKHIVSPGVKMPATPIVSNGPVILKPID
jgi:hypothetical protein